MNIAPVILWNLHHSSAYMVVCERGWAGQVKEEREVSEREKGEPYVSQ